MAPSASSRQRNYAARISNQEWEKWKDEIRTEFLSDKPVEKVVETLNHRGLNVTKPQLEHKAKQWRLRRKLRAKTWRYVDHTVRKRKTAGKDSVVILSGKRLCSEKVADETARHQIRSLIRQTTPDSPGSEINLFVCTPRASTPSPAAFMLLPRSLPWYQFLHTVSLNLLPALHAPSARNKNAAIPQTFEDDEDTITLLARDDQKHIVKTATPATINFVLRQLVRRTIQILIRSKELSKLQTASLGVDWVAAQFSSMLPESFAGHNLQRASSLIANKHHDQERNLLHMLIYLASNHLILDERNFLGRNLRTAEALVLLFRLTDRGSPSMLHNLIQFSRESPTLAAVVEELFQAAMMIGALDIVANILEENPWMITLGIRSSLGWPSCVLPPLHYAVFHGSVDLVNLLMKFQADVNEVSDQGRFFEGWTPLALAACRSPHQMSMNMANILLQNNAMPNPEGSYAPLSLCLIHGNVSLALQLIELGASDSRFDSYQRLSFSDDVCWMLTQTQSLLKDYSMVGFAVSVSVPRSSTCDADEADNADELVVLRLLEALQAATKPHCGSDAMILAASRGHLKVMSYLRTEIGQAVDSTNGALSPLYAAVLWGRVDAARQLLEWGASASMDERLRERWIAKQNGLPTPLHIAIQFGSSDMVRLLIQYGGEVDQPSKFFTDIYSSQWNPSRWKPTEWVGYWGSYQSPRTPTCVALCPLLFAVLQSRWDEAETLLAMGAEPCGDVLFEAAEQGQLELVARLLDKGVRPDDLGRYGLSSLEAAASQGHEPVVSYLLRAGATICNTSFAALFCLSSVSIIKTLLQTHLEWPKLRDKRTNRSYLENAILRGHKDVVDLALQIDQDYYDSGALCAATTQDIMFHSSDAHLLIHELIKRRERSFCTESQVQLSLESTAISMAAFHDRLEIVGLLLRSREHDFCWALGVRFETWDLLFTPQKKICDKWHTSRAPDASPLEYAAKGRSERVSLRLLQEGYRADIRSIFAAMSHLKNDVVGMFIEQCEDINVAYQGRTLFQEAVQTRNIPLVKRLLAKGADVNMYQRREFTKPQTRYRPPALTIAAEAGDLDLVSLLLENGADVNKGHSSAAECTALQLAVAKGYIGIVKCLITHGADIYARRFPVQGLQSSHGTPLEEAARWGRLDIVHLLLDSGLSTIGYHRVQYVLSIIYAQKSGNHTVVQALHNHRPWSLEDQEIYQELTDEFPPRQTIFFHPKEYPEAEFLGAVQKEMRQLGLGYALSRWWKKDVPLIRMAFGMVEDISDTEFEGSTDEFESEEESIEGSIDDFDSDEEEGIEDSADNNFESNQEEAVARMNEDSSASPAIEDTTFRNDSILTTINDDGEFGSHASFSNFSQVGALMDVENSCVSWPYHSGPERPEGDGSNIPMEPDSQILQYQFEGDNASLFRPVGEIMDAFDPSLWPSNDVLTDIFEWPGENEVNVSTDLSNCNLDPTFNGWQQDADSGMEFDDMFDLSEWF